MSRRRLYRVDVNGRRIRASWWERIIQRLGIGL